MLKQSVIALGITGGCIFLGNKLQVKIYSNSLFNVLFILILKHHQKLGGFDSENLYLPFYTLNSRHTMIDKSYYIDMI